MNGIVAGGWSYVVSAYVVSFVVLGGYLVHAIALFRKAAQRPVR
jgi:hypothetical protein